MLTNTRMLGLIGIYLVIFIDNLGASLIIPMLTPITHDPITGLITKGTENFRNSFYGAALGIFSIAMFFGAPLLGTLSDSLGRKKTLLLCLSGLAMSYVFMTLALEIKSLWLFMIGRFISGFFSGSLPVAQASIIDVTEENHRAKYIGYVMFFVSLGYIIGPLIGGYLSDPMLVPWFNLKTPFIFVVIISVVNFLILLFLFQNQKIDLKGSTKTLPNPIANLLDAVRIREIRTLALLLFLMLMGWNTFFQFIGLYLTGVLGFNQQEVSSFISWTGFGLALAFLFLVGVAIKRLRPLGMVGLGLTLMNLCIGVILLLRTHQYVLYLLAMLGGIGFGLSYSGLMAQLSISVDTRKQGAIMGMAAAIAAFCAGLSGFIFGSVTNISIDSPIISALLFIGLAIIICYKKYIKQTEL